MMGKNFFISDIDGTIYREKTISISELNFFNSLQKKFQVVLATGRNYAMFQKIVSDFKLSYDYCILNNGALILDKNDNVILNLQLKSQEPMLLIEKFVTNFQINLNITFSYLEKNIFLENVNDINFTKKIDKSLKYVNSISLEIHSYIDLEKEIGTVITGIRNIGFVVNQNKQYIDISPVASGKASSIICLGTLNKTNIRKAIIVGDDLNDKEMLALSPNSYCLRSGNKKLYSVATNIIDSIDEIPISERL